MRDWHEQARLLREQGEKQMAIAAMLHKSLGAVQYAIGDEDAREKARKRRRLSRIRASVRAAGRGLVLRTIRKFSEEEDERLTELRIEGSSLRQIARAMGRATSSVRVRLVTLAKREEQ